MPTATTRCALPQQACSRSKYLPSLEPEVGRTELAAALPALRELRVRRVRRVCARQSTQTIAMLPT